MKKRQFSPARRQPERRTSGADLLALLVVGVALRLAVELVVPPPNLYSITLPVDR